MKYENVYELIEAMAGHVERTMTHYKQDFYCYDLKTLLENEKDGRCYTLYWFTRPTGTWFVNDEDARSCKYYSDHEFIVTRHEDGTYEMNEVEITVKKI